MSGTCPTPCISAPRSEICPLTHVATLGPEVLPLLAYCTSARISSYSRSSVIEHTVRVTNTDTKAETAIIIVNNMQFFLTTPSPSPLFVSHPRNIPAQYSIHSLIRRSHRHSILSIRSSAGLTGIVFYPFTHQPALYPQLIVCERHASVISRILKRLMIERKEFLLHGLLHGFFYIILCQSKLSCSDCCSQKNNIKYL